MGLAVSGVSLFRSIGGCAGVAVFGSLCNHGLADPLIQTDLALQTQGRALSPALIHSLPPASQRLYFSTFAGAMDRLFVIATVMMLPAFVMTWFIREAEPQPRTMAGHD